MLKLTNLSAHKPVAFVSLSGNEDSLPIIEDDVSFVQDIQLMMYGLGDCQQPLKESAELVESIVLDQMISLLHQVSEISELRQRTVVAPEDILFLMKRNLKAVKRLIAYLGVKDEAQLHNSILRPSSDGTLTDMSSSQEADVDDSTRFHPNFDRNLPLDWKKGRRKYCLLYLKKLNIEESDLNQIIDIIKEARLNRANSIALSLSPKAYEAFHTARCKSFSSTNMTEKRFHKWLVNKGKWAEEITSPVLEILVYLGKETIACLVDMVMTLREESDIKTKMGTVYSSAITPEEIHEVVRRCFFHHTASLNAFSRSVSSAQRRRLIVL